MLFYSAYSYHSSWSVRCALAEHHNDCTEDNPNWQEYILSYGALPITSPTAEPTPLPTLLPTPKPTPLPTEAEPTWKHVGYGGCTDGNWMIIGTASSLEDAKSLMLDHEECSKNGSMLFYSAYSYHSSWSVRCALAEHHNSCTEDNPNWQEYILYYGASSATLPAASSATEPSRGTAGQDSFSSTSRGTTLLEGSLLWMAVSCFLIGIVVTCCAIKLRKKMRTYVEKNEVELVVTVES